MSTALTFQSIANSSLPAPEKSQLMKAYERITGREAPGHLAIHRAKRHAVEGVHAVRAGGEGLVVGGLLGLAQAEMKNGLDIPVRGKHVPIDGVGALVAFGAATYLANEDAGIATDFRNAGTAMAGVFAFRMASKWRQSQKSGQVHGEDDESDIDSIEGSDMGEDPLIAAARKLK